ncbi:hypothetical protein JCM10914A_03280 [Paenibacillus sp. JCM 10914]|nr:hypothetical protein JCM10914_5890 [Paenibacillus sp. JCM 10914]
MMKFIVAYVVFQIIIFTVLIVISSKKDKRFAAAIQKPPPNFEPTNEVFYDPIENIMKRVYYNQFTGERIYLTELD